jgi:hypothetical protein
VIPRRKVRAGGTTWPLEESNLGLVIEYSDDFARMKALIELVRAERVFLASRKQQDIPANAEAIRRPILGLKKGK